MERLVIDATLHEKLKNLAHPVELVTEQGYVVAVVQPRLDPALYEVIGDEPSPEEVERRLKGDRRIPADEVIPRLRKLA